MIRENNITILGGSFNPIHNGHIEMAKCAARQYNLENIVFMPNKSTYYKDNDAFVSDKDRINMLKLAIEDYDYMSVSDMEIRRGGVTHTIDTIRELKEEDPDRKIYFIIGGDSLEWVEKWVDADELLGSVDSQVVLTFGIFTDEGNFHDFVIDLEAAGVFNFFFDEFDRVGHVPAIDRLGTGNGADPADFDFIRDILREGVRDGAQQTAHNQ